MRSTRPAAPSRCRRQNQRHLQTLTRLQSLQLHLSPVQIHQVLPMLTGRIPGPGPDLIQNERHWLAALVLAGVLDYWMWELINRWAMAAG